MIGAAFTLVALAVICLGLFLGWLWTKYCVEIREPRREAQFNAEMASKFGPQFTPEAMKRHVTASRGNVFRYRHPDFDAMRRSSKAGAA